MMRAGGPAQNGPATVAPNSSALAIVNAPKRRPVLAQHSKARSKAEAQFKQVQKPQLATQPTTKGGQATADYLAAGHAVRAKTAQLRELRLAKEGAATVTKKSSR